MDEQGKSSARVDAFAPPEDYLVETEFQEPGPRPMPAFVYESGHVKKQKQIQRSLLVVAILCMAAQFLGPVQQLADYVLPLAYIGWLGIVLMLFYLGAVISLMRGTGPLKYLTHGEATIVQIVEIVKAPTTVINGSETLFAFVVTVRMRHLVTGEIIDTTTASDGLPSNEKDRHHTTLRVGDFATALYFPENPIDSLKLYGFLGVNPAVNYLRKEEQDRLLLNVGIIILAVLLFGGVILALFSMERYETLDFPINGLMISAIAMGAIVGISGVIVGYVYQKTKDREREARNAVALETGGVVELAYSPDGRFGKFQSVLYGGALLLGAPLICGLVSACSLLFLNGFLDRSEPRSVPAQLGDRYTETQSLILRQYKVDYVLEGEEKERTLSTSPEGLAVLIHSQAGTALVKEGFMDWPWVESIVPASEHVAHRSVPQSSVLSPRHNNS